MPVVSVVSVRKHALLVYGPLVPASTQLGIFIPTHFEQRHSVVLSTLVLVCVICLDEFHTLAQNFYESGSMIPQELALSCSQVNA